MPESPHRSSSRSVAAVLVSVLMLAMVAAIGATPAEAKRIVAARARYPAIEPLAGYQPQTTCSPVAKPGVVDLSKRLLKAFPTTRSLGIVRACSVGGQSEHKEGRAFDWGGLNAHSAKDRARVARFVHWLTKTDKYGNRYAMTRRLGIQYLIWNHKIWGSYAAAAGWRKYTGADPHTNHVHISFTWAGARKKTSFWTGKVGNVGATPTPTPTHPVPTPPTAPKPPDRRHHAAAARAGPGAVPAAGRGARGRDRDPGRHLGRHAHPRRPDRRPALPGRGLRHLAMGQEGRPDRRRGVLDDRRRPDLASRPLGAHDGAGQRPPRPLCRRQRHGRRPDTDTGGSCDTVNHTYRWTYTPTRTGRVELASWDPTTLADNSGALTIRVIKSSPVDQMTWSVPANAGAGVTSPGALAAGETYVVTVSGTVATGGGVLADAECSTTPGDPVWRRDRTADPAYPGAERLDVLVDKQATAFSAVTDSDGSSCDVTNHAYRTVLKPSSTRPINLRVDDPTPLDNTGALTVTATRVVQPTGPETVALNTTVPAGAQTARTYLSGRVLRVTATGTYTVAPGVTADAECTRTTTDPIWSSTRANVDGDVTVGGSNPVFRGPGSAACDATNHAYTLTYTPSTTGPLSFGLADTVFSDNAGTVTLTVTPVG